MLGIHNASTPFGLKAMEELKRLIELYDYRNKIHIRLNEQNEFLMAELPSNKVEAYKLFQKVYDNGNGYILDVWAYRNDIDSFTIDPFIDLLSKVGFWAKYKNNKKEGK